MMDDVSEPTANWKATMGEIVAAMTEPGIQRGTA